MIVGSDSARKLLLLGALTCSTPGDVHEALGAPVASFTRPSVGRSSHPGPRDGTNAGNGGTDVDTTLYSGTGNGGTKGRHDSS